MSVKAKPDIKIIKPPNDIYLYEEYVTTLHDLTRTKAQYMQL